MDPIKHVNIAYGSIEARVLALAETDPVKLIQLCRDAGINVVLSADQSIAEHHKQLVEMMTRFVVKGAESLRQRPRYQVPRLRTMFQGTPKKPPINGAAKCARRRKQIAKGMLNASSGLVSTLP